MKILFTVFRKIFCSSTSHQRKKQMRNSLLEFLTYSKQTTFFFNSSLLKVCECLLATFTPYTRRAVSLNCFVSGGESYSLGHSDPLLKISFEFYKYLQSFLYKYLKGFP